MVVFDGCVAHAQGYTIVVSCYLMQQHLHTVSVHGLTKTNFITHDTYTIYIHIEHSRNSYTRRSMPMRSMMSGEHTYDRYNTTLLPPIRMHVIQHDTKLK